MKKVTIIYEFESCNGCPFASEYRDMGAYTVICGKQEGLCPIYDRRTRELCPIKDKEIVEVRKEERNVHYH